MTHRPMTALVTGAASGIGRATAERFLAEGWSVAAADVNIQTAQAQVNRWTEGGIDPARIEVLRADVSREADVEATVAATLERFGQLDCMVNNAGVAGAFGPVTEVEAEDWDYTFAIVMRGVFLGTKHAARAMKAQGRGGVIVNLGSVSGVTGGTGPHAYSAAKAGVINFGRTAAIELAPFRIRVNTVSPGIIQTPLTETGRRDIAAGVAGVQPWPDVGRPEQIASVIHFLASDGAGFMTGENVVVDGGLMATGPRLGDRIGGDPASRGLAGVNRGSTGEPHKVRKLDQSS